MAKRIKTISETHCVGCFNLRTKRVYTVEELKAIRNKYIVKPKKKTRNYGISPVVLKMLKDKKNKGVMVVWCRKKHLPIIYKMSRELKRYDSLNKDCPDFEGE